MQRSIIVVFLLSLLASGSLLQVGDAEARQRLRRGQYDTGRGGAGSFDTARQRERGHVERDAAWWNERGAGSARGSRQWDREAGTWSRAREISRPGGGTVSSSRQGQRNPDETYAVTANRTGAGGRTATMDRAITPGGDGSVDISTTYSRPGGQAVQVDKTVTRTEEGRSVSGTYSSSTGGGGFESDVSRTGQGRSRTTSITKDTGETRSRATTWARDGDALGRASVITLPDGSTRTRAVSITFETDQP